MREITRHISPNNSWVYETQTHNHQKNTRQTPLSNQKQTEKEYVLHLGSSHMPVIAESYTSTISQCDQIQACLTSISGAGKSPAL
jgi:hypothetical protein